MRRDRARRRLALAVLVLWWLPTLGGVATALPALHGHGAHHHGVHAPGAHGYGDPTHGAHAHGAHTHATPEQDALAHTGHSHGGTHSHGTHSHETQGTEGVHEHGGAAEPERSPVGGSATAPDGGDAVPGPAALEWVQALIHGHSHGASEPDHDHPAPRAPVSVPVVPVLAPLAAATAAPAAGGCPPAVAAGHGPSPLPLSSLFVSLCSFLL